MTSDKLQAVKDAREAVNLATGKAVYNDAAIPEVCKWNQIDPHIETIQTALAVLEAAYEEQIKCEKKARFQRKLNSVLADIATTEKLVAEFMEG